MATVLGGGMYVGVEYYKDQSIRQESVKVEARADITASEINEDVQATRARLSTVSYSVESFATPDLLTVLSGPQTIGARLIAANGTVLADRGQTDIVHEAAVGDNVSALPYFQEALTAKTAFSEPVLLSDRHQYVTVIAAPIIGDGSIRAVITATTTLETHSRTDVDRHVTITDGSNQTAATRPLSSGVPDRITAQSVVPATGWTVTVGRDTAALRARLNNLAVLQGVGIVIVLLLTGAFGVWQYRAFVRQLTAMERGFSALEASEYTHSLSLTGSDEWHRITEGYEHVTDELRARERAIREREQRLSVLSRILRHNLRNEVNAVFLNVEHIAETADDEAVAERARTAKERTRKLSEITKKARTAEKSLEGSEGDRVTHDLVELVHETSSAVTDAYPDARIDIEVVDRPTVVGIPTVSAAIENVIENACEHAGDSPTVEITVRAVPERDRAEVVVTDDGPGIPEQEIDVLESETETKLEHGSGIGLWLTKWAIERSGGTVDIEPLDVGGTRVTLGFELAAEGSAERTGSPTDDI